jgi:hypothetical protein
MAEDSIAEPDIGGKAAGLMSVDMWSLIDGTPTFMSDWSSSIAVACITGSAMSTDPIADGWLGRIALTRRSNSDLRGRVSCSIMTASPVLGGALCHAPGCWSTHRVDTSWSDVGTASLRR